MVKRIDRRQKPIWRKMRRPIPPPLKVIEPKKRVKNYFPERKIFKDEEEDIKEELRRRMVRKRESLRIEEVEEKSKKIEDLFFSLSEVEGAENFFSYVDFRNEVKTKNIINRLISMKKKVYVPITLLKENRLLISEIRSLEELKEGCFGILEPDKRFWRIISPETIDIAIVPGIVFDVEGFRVGFGKGFYDRLLPNLRKDALFIGLGYKFQVIKSFPHDINDIPLHLIITEEGILFP